MANKPLKLSNAQFVRLYKDDRDELITLRNAVFGTTRLTLIDLIRDCVHEGLPAVRKNLAPLVKEKAA